MRRSIFRSILDEEKPTFYGNYCEIIGKTCALIYNCQTYEKKSSAHLKPSSSVASASASQTEARKKQQHILGVKFLSNSHTY